MKISSPMRRTKIIATLGPASDDDKVLAAMIKAGVDVVRINFSHGELADHQRRIAAVRHIAAQQNKFVAILADLQGPKIRISRFRHDFITLAKNDHFAIDVALGHNDGDQFQVGCDYLPLASDVKAEDILLLDDGRIVFKVLAVHGSRIECQVLVGGCLSNNKGINKQGGGLSASALTAKDKVDLQSAIALKVDYLAISFPRSSHDMQRARQLLGQAGQEIRLIAKIERAEAVMDSDTLDRIILASDAVMVARGDLGVEIGDAELIGVQKKIIARARTLDRLVITATQMMESMINSILPTRAEIFDVANAVLDGTDAVMCSAETASGHYPVETIEAMARCCLGAERERAAQQSKHRLKDTFMQVDETVALSAMYAANHLQGVAAIACLTDSGHTPLIASRIRSGLPIIALSHHSHTLRRMALCRGVLPLYIEQAAIETTQIETLVLEKLKKHQLIEENDIVIITCGNYQSYQGGTNMMYIAQLK